jgi:hypothetical protein
LPAFISLKTRTPLLIVFLLLNLVSREQVLHGKVIDKTTGQTLPYASVGVYKKNIGGIADRDGTFSIDLSQADNKDSLRISYIGYAGFTLSLARLNPANELTIGLTPMPKELPAIAVAGKRQLIEIGNVTYTGRFTGWGDYSSSRGRLRGLMIAPKEYPVRAVGFACHLKHNTFDSVKVRLHILEFQGDSLPLKELLQDNIYLIIPKNATWVDINLTPYNIVIKDTIVLAVEWVDAWAPAGKPGRESNLLTFSLAKTAGYVYVRDYPFERPALIKNPETPAMYLKAYRVGKGN